MRKINFLNVCFKHFFTNRLFLHVQTIRVEKMLDINGNMKIHCTFKNKCGIQDGSKNEICMNMEMNRTEPELDLYSKCFETDIFKRQNLHYANTPVQYTAIFHGCKNDQFSDDFFFFKFLFLLKT